MQWYRSRNRLPEEGVEVLVCLEGGKHCEVSRLVRYKNYPSGSVLMWQHGRSTGWDDYWAYIELPQIQTAEDAK